MSELQKENKLLRQENKELREKLEITLAELAKKKVTKDSHNSHNPPSQDKSKPKKKSLRKKTGRKSGGQKGHKGHHLAMTDKPDEVHKIKSNNCSKCGNGLEHHQHEFLSKRQVIEIPEIQPKYIEYQQHGCECGNCGHHQKASFPQGVHAPIQYGSNIIALVSYFSVYHFLPFRRMTQLFQDVFLLPLSEGSVQNLLIKAAKKAKPMYDDILQQIFSSNYVGSDETSAKVNGKKWWIWVWQNTKNTYLKAAKSRGFITVLETIGDRLSHATVGSDRFAAQLKMVSKFKQLCISHLLRDLIFLLQRNPFGRRNRI
jgi:transposase